MWNILRFIYICIYECVSSDKVQSSRLRSQNYWVTFLVSCIIVIQLLGFIIVSSDQQFLAGAGVTKMDRTQPLLTEDWRLMNKIAQSSIYLLPKER